MSAEVDALKRQLELVASALRAKDPAAYRAKLVDLLRLCPPPRAPSSGDAATPVWAASDRETILAAAESYLRMRPGPKRLRDIHAHLDARGIVVGGARPRASLAAKMRADPRFASEGRDAWALSPKAIEAARLERFFQENERARRRFRRAAERRPSNDVETAPATH